jgi:hypothetical protein
MSLKGFSEQWKSFIKGVASCEKLPDWNRLWDDFIQKKLRDEDLQHMNSEENALSSQINKRKGMKYLIEVSFYTCNEFGNYVIQSLNKKKGGKGKQVEMDAPTMSGEEELAKKFEDEFILLSHLLESTICEGAWFLDSGATRNMTGTREVFESLTEWDSYLHVRIGDQSWHVVKGVRSVPFRMELGGVL